MRPQAHLLDGRSAVGFGILVGLAMTASFFIEEGLMTDTPPEPPDIGPEGPVHEDDPPTEPDGGPEGRRSPHWA
jgi:hypothetical protein